MIKKLFILPVLATILFTGCNNTTTNSSEEKTDSSTCVASISVDSFLMVAENNVGKELTVKGTVDHVCKHGGKRVRIFSLHPTKSIHGEAGDGFGSFKTELEGSDVCLTGIVLESKIDMVYLDEWETELQKATDEEKEETDMEHEKGVDHHAKLEEINKYREQLKNSNKEFIAFYSLEVSKMTECKTEAKPCCSKMTIEDSVKKPCCANQSADTSTCCSEK